MKEIKAYIRPDALEPVIRELEKAGAKDMTVIRVDAIGGMSDGEADRQHYFRKYYAKYSAVSKLEIVCRDAEAAGFVEIIRSLARTGDPGDGRIFVNEVTDAVNVRSGARGEAAL